MFPLAGGNSLKSTYSQLRIFSTSFLGSVGIPLPRETSAIGLFSDDRAAASETWDPPSDGVTAAAGAVELKTAVPLGCTGGSVVLP